MWILVFNVTCISFIKLKWVQQKIIKKFQKLKEKKWKCQNIDSWNFIRWTNKEIIDWKVDEKSLQIRRWKHLRTLPITPFTVNWLINKLLNIYGKSFVGSFPNSQSIIKFQGQILIVTTRNTTTEITVEKSLKFICKKYKYLVLKFWRNA